VRRQNPAEVFADTWLSLEAANLNGEYLVTIGHPPTACANAINHLEGEGVPEQQGVSMENDPKSDTDIEPVLQPCLSAVPCRMLQLSPDVDARARGMYAAVCH